MSELRKDNNRQTLGINERFQKERSSASDIVYTCIVSFLPSHPKALLISVTAPVRSPLLCPMHVKRDNDNFMYRCSSHDRQPITTLLSSCPWEHIKCPRLALRPLGQWTPYQRLVVNLLSDELVLTERVACLSCDGVNGAFLHLLLDGTEEGEERFACTLLQRDLEREQQRKSWEGGRKLWSHCYTWFTDSKV